MGPLEGRMSIDSVILHNTSVNLEDLFCCVVGIERERERARRGEEVEM